MFGKTHSEEIRKKISEAKKGKPRPAGAGSPSKAINVFDNETKLTTTYESIGEAARLLDINKTIISQYIRNNQKKPYKGKFVFTKI
jgi:group I intron endonuclease